MKLEKAIEILTDLPFYPNTPSQNDYANAIHLGREALKSKIEARKFKVHSSAVLLPGETED